MTGPFTNPIAIGTYPGDASRLFVAERAGKVRLVVDDAVRPDPYLDVGPGIDLDGERGLLSIVAAPDYASSGKVYVYYTDSGGDIRIDEFTRSAVDPEVADPATRRNVLTIEHSQISNHNGGQLHFGADGCLWVTTGDGGGGERPVQQRPEPRNAAGEDPADQSEPAGSRRPACPACRRRPARRRQPAGQHRTRAHGARAAPPASPPAPAARSSGCAATRPAA